MGASVIICKLVTMGNSFGINIPAPFRRRMGLLLGDYLRMELDGDTLTIRSNSVKQTKIRKRTSGQGAGALVKRSIRQ